MRCIKILHFTRDSYQSGVPSVTFHTIMLERVILNIQIDKISVGYLYFIMMVLLKCIIPTATIADSYELVYQRLISTDDRHINYHKCHDILPGVVNSTLKSHRTLTSKVLIIYSVIFIHYQMLSVILQDWNSQHCCFTGNYHMSWMVQGIH